MRRSGLLALFLLAPLAAGCGPAGGDLPPPAAEPGPPAETVENPQYANWAKFKPGTAVVHRTVTAAAGVADTTTTVIRYTLVAVTPDYVEVESRATTRRYDGLETNNPPETSRHPKRVPLPPGAARDGSGKPAGEETVTAGGKEYRAVRHAGNSQNEAGEVFTRVWSSDAVPGRLVMSVTETPAIGKTTTIEVVEVRLP